MGKCACGVRVHVLCVVCACVCTCMQYVRRFHGKAELYILRLPTYA